MNRCLAPCVVSLLLTAPALCLAADEPEDTPGARYVLGVSLIERPEYAGARQYKAKLQPLWAVQWGRWRISTSGGSGLLGFGRDAAGAGASRELVKTDSLRLGVSLRIDSGRSSADSTTTQGLPDVRKTLRGRVYASYSLAPDWNLTGALSQDLAGRQGGLTAGLDLGWRMYRTARTEWTSGVGISLADAQNMRSYFGVSPDAALATGRVAYVPNAGLRDVHAGVGFTHSISKHWFTFGGAGASRLLGPAADSPLTQKADGAYASIGLAWRN